MPLKIFAAACLMIPAAICRADDRAFLNTAILGLPREYFADVPLEKRQMFLLAASNDTDASRLDYNGGWFHWYSDSQDFEASSQIYLKLLPRPKGFPLVFVHMPKPFANGSEPSANQTFVFECTNPSVPEWRDVTKQVMPANADLTLHYKPDAESLDVEVIPWLRFERKDSRGQALKPGEPVGVLKWDGKTLRQEKPRKKE